MIDVQTIVSDATIAARKPATNQESSKVYYDVVNLMNEDKRTGRDFKQDLVALNQKLHAEHILPLFDIVGVSDDGVSLVVQDRGNSAAQTHRESVDQFAADFHPADSTTYPSGTKRVFTTDANGTLTSCTDYDGTTYRLENGKYSHYDKDMKLITADAPLDATMSVDSAGNLKISNHNPPTVQILKADGTSITYDSDPANAGAKIIETTHLDRSGSSVKTSYKYDGDQLISVSSGGETLSKDGHNQLSVDGNGNLTEDTINDDGSIAQRTVVAVAGTMVISEPDHNKQLHVTNIRYPNGAGFNVVYKDPPQDDSILLLNASDKPAAIYAQDNTAISQINADGSFAIYSDNKTALHKANGSVAYADRLPAEISLTTAIDYPNGQTRTFQYDDKHELVAVRETDGHVWKKENGGWQEYASADPNAQKLAGFDTMTRSIDSQGNYTQIAADGSASVYASDGSVVHSPLVLQPVDSQSGDASTSPGTTNSSDGISTSRDGAGRITQIAEPDGALTTFKYSDGETQPSQITRTQKNGEQEILSKQVDGTWIKQDIIPGSQASIRPSKIDQVKFDATTGEFTTVKLEFPTDTRGVETSQKPNGDVTVTAKDGKESTTYKHGTDGNVNYVTTVFGNGSSEELTNEGAGVWKRHTNGAVPGAPSDATVDDTVKDLQFADKLHYSYMSETSLGQMKTNQAVAGPRQYLTTFSNGDSVLRDYGPNGKLLELVRTDKSNGNREVLINHDDGRVEVEITHADNSRESGTNGVFDVKTGDYSYTTADGKVRIEQRANGTRIEGIPGDAGVIARIDKVEWVDQGGVSSRSYKYDRHGQLIETTGTGTAKDEHWISNGDGTFHREKDGLIAHVKIEIGNNDCFTSIYVDENGQVRVESQDADGHVHKRFGKTSSPAAFGDSGRLAQIREDGSYVYKIQAGDTLSSIARDALQMQGKTNPSDDDVAREVAKIARDNGISNPNLIYENNLLIIK